MSQANEEKKFYAEKTRVEEEKEEAERQVKKGPFWFFLDFF